MASLMKLSATLQILAVVTMLAAVFAQQTTAKTHYLYWTVDNATLTRDCNTVTVPTVNGISPGPLVEIDEGDTLVIKVTNKQVYPVTMHWHGINQVGTNYADGPAHITQCPIKEGGSYIYEFTVDNQSGTFWYHAHINWLLATVHGALIVKPKVKPPYAISPIEDEIPIILGEWFGLSPNVFELDFLDTVNLRENATSTTPTINGNPGPLYNCSKGPEVFKVKPGKTYLLRIINAALNNDYYFRVANHKVKVVGADGNYLKPFRTKIIAIAPGQTTDVLLTATKTPGKYYFGIDVGPNAAVGFPPPSIPALGMFEYTNAPAWATPEVPKFPNNVTLKPMDRYVKKLRNYGTYALSKKLDQDLIYTVNTAVTFCAPTEPCAGSVKIIGAVQNITFDAPTTTSILQAYASGANGVYQADFPDRPPSLHFNETGPDANYGLASRGTRVKMLNYGDTVQIVLQNVYSGGILDHPFHLHGHDFYVVGRGYGVYNPDVDQASFNLVDPPKYSTFGVPNAGWVAIRFHANNPGAWLFHCHFDKHKSWGMMMVFITKNGGGHTLKAPLHPLPQCT